MILRDKIFKALENSSLNLKQLQELTKHKYVSQALYYLTKKGYIKKVGKEWSLDNPPRKYTVVEMKRKRIRIYD